MSKVTTFNGQDGTSSTELFFHQFSGRPVDQYDWPNSDGDPRANIGDVFVLTVRAEVVKVVEDEVKDGRRQTIGFKVVDSKLGSMVTKADQSDPNQTSIDDVNDENEANVDFGDYGDEVDFGGYGGDDDDPVTDDDSHDDGHDNPFTIVSNGDA